MLQITPGVKCILWINIIFFALGFALNYFGIDLDRHLALFYIKSPYFKPLQFISYMFMHGSIMHIFFNMFALVQFGGFIEYNWGVKRFVFYYLATGIGAAIVHTIVTYYQVSPFMDAVRVYFSNPTPDTFEAILPTCHQYFDEAAFANIASAWRAGLVNEQEIIDNTISQLQEFLDSPVFGHPMVGASGAVFGLLLAFGMMFPNLKLQIILIPIGIPAKYFVIIYGVIELFFGIQNFEGDNIAHYAHLGGMLFGLLLLLWWRKYPHNEMFN